MKPSAAREEHDGLYRLSSITLDFESVGFLIDIVKRFCGKTLLSMVRPKAVLAQFRPAWAEQAYMRAAGIPHVIENWSHPGGLSGALPRVVVPASGTIAPAEEALRALREISDLDKTLSDQEKAVSEAFEALVRNDLTAALEWSRWGDAEHYHSVTRAALIEVMPFPVNRFHAWTEKQKMLLRLRFHAKIVDEEGAKRAANRGYEALAKQLGNGPWMFQSKGPTSLDCVVFGHIMDALREPVGAIVLKHYASLVSFCERVHGFFFENPSPRIQALCALSGREENAFIEKLGFDSVYKGPSTRISSWAEEDNEAEDEEMSRRLADKDSEFREGSRNAVIVTGGIVVIYLLYTKMIAFEIVSNDDDEEGEE